MTIDENKRTAPMQKFMFVEAQAAQACLTHHNAYLR